MMESDPTPAQRPAVAQRADEVVSRRGSAYPPDFAARMRGRDKKALADLFGLQAFGVNLTRLAPGAMSALRHAHSREDEFVYILEGQPTLYTDAGATLLAPGMCAGFAAGSGDAHHLVNESMQDVLYLEIGARCADDEARYPDDDLVARKQDGSWRFLHKDGRPY